MVLFSLDWPSREKFVQKLPWWHVIKELRFRWHVIEGIIFTPHSILNILIFCFDHDFLIDDYECCTLTIFSCHQLWNVCKLVFRNNIICQICKFLRWFKIFLVWKQKSAKVNHHLFGEGKRINYNSRKKYNFFYLWMTIF